MQIERQARELEKSRQQQEASSRVLHIIGGSPGALTPVFQAIVKNAVEVCGARFGAMFKMEGNLLHLVADYNFGATQRRLLEVQYPMAPNRGHVSGRAILTRSTVQIPDTNADEDYAGLEAKRSGFRSLLATPLLKGDQTIGSIVIYKAEPGMFPARQLDLLQNFAAQAVIAIENARLFNETQDALQRQTATANILKVIAASPSDVQPVFDAIVANADRLISGFTTGVYRFVDDIIHLAAITSVSPDADAALKAQFPRPAGDAKHFRMALAGEVWAVADTEAQPDKPLKDIARVRGFRSVLYSPLMSNGKSIGVIVVSRRNPGPFSAHHVELLRTFAARP